MNKAILPAAAALLAVASGCSQQENIIEKPDYTSHTGIFDIAALEALGRVSNPQVSPAGDRILYGVSYESVEQNRSNNELYTMALDGSDVKRLTKTAQSESEAVWIDGGKKIAFVAEHDGKPQMWVMNADGTNRHVVSRLENGVSGFKVSPDGKKVVVISSVQLVNAVKANYPDLPKANARIITDMMYKHWDEWVTEVPHPFIAEFDNYRLTNIVDIMADEPDFEAPMKPFGGSESFAWSPDSKELIYVSRKKSGKEYSLSTNSDLYAYNLESGETRNLTEGMMGYDTCPVFSPDGTKLAWLSMEHDGRESDQNRIFVMDWKSGQKTNLTDQWDYTADQIAWYPDSKKLYFIAPYQGVTPIFAIDVDSHKVECVSSPDNFEDIDTWITKQENYCDYAALAPVDGKTLITMRHSFVYPNEIFSLTDKKAICLSKVNDELLSSIERPNMALVRIPTTDGNLMTTWVIFPPQFDESKQYPAILYCQGGPQQPVSQFWSYRWNLMLMASKGYVVIAPNRHGLPGFGQEWLDQISGDYTGQNMQDYLAAVDFMKVKPYINEKAIGAVGASYGGYSVYMLAGIHEGRFAALIAHAGIFNTEAQYLETEEMWFANRDMGGAYWEKDNAIAQRTFAGSPHKMVDRWDTPIMVTHGEYDYRILSSQGEMAFNAAVLRGIPAKMVIFPDENHWILKPQNAILWQEEFFKWLDLWLKVPFAPANQQAAEAAADQSSTPEAEATTQA